MTKPQDISIIVYEDEYAHDAIAMWRASKENAIGVKEPHSIDDHLDFLCHRLLKNNAIHLAIDRASNVVVGLMASNGNELNQLYIHVDYQRDGIGSRLLNLAKQSSTGKLRLYTFDVNFAAQCFYEKHGFRVIGRGHENEEGLPDVRYEWIASPVET